MGTAEGVKQSMIVFAPAAPSACSYESTNPPIVMLAASLGRAGLGLPSVRGFWCGVEGGSFGFMRRARVRGVARADSHSCQEVPSTE